MRAATAPPYSLVWLAVGEEGGGLAVALANLAVECQRRGHRVTVLAIADGPLVALCRKRGLTVNVLGLPVPRNFAGNVVQKVGRLVESHAYLRRHAPSIAAAVREVRGETLHVLSPSLLRLMCRAARLANARPIWEMPNAMSGRLLGLNRALYRRVIRRDRVLVLANSAYTADTIRGGEVEPIVFYPAVDGSRFDPDRMTPSRAEVPADAVTMAIVARLVPDKGQAETVEAMEMLTPELPALRLLIVGGPLDSAFAKRLQARVVALGLTDRVRFIGPTDDPATQLASANFAISARTVEEPFGMSIVEAQLMRRPVLVRALGGPAEIVVDGETGWHVADATADAIAQGIRRAMADRPRWPAMGEAGRRRSLRIFTAEVAAGRYLELLAARRASPT